MNAAAPHLMGREVRLVRVEPEKRVVRSAPAQFMVPQIQIPRAHPGFVDGYSQPLLAQLDVLAGGTAQSAQTDMGVDTRDQFTGAEGFDEVVIRTDIESFDARFLSGAGR